MPVVLPRRLSSYRESLSQRPPASFNKNQEQFLQLLKSGYSRLGFRHWLPLLLLLLFLVLVSGLFYVFENLNWNQANQTDVQACEENIQRARHQLHQRFWELHADTSLSRERVIFHTRNALAWYENITVCRRQPKLAWDFAAAFFYSLTIFTTIGYGEITPATTAGKLLTMMSCVVGIPMVFIILNDFGDVISRHLLRLWFKLCQLWSGKAPPDTPATPEERVEEEEEALHQLPLTIPLTTTLVWMFLCAGVFRLCEQEWTFFNSFYFVFVSLTTIGLGDTVPQHVTYTILNFWMVFLGLAMVSMCIQVVQAKVEAWVTSKILREYKLNQEQQLLDEFQAETQQKPSESPSVHSERDRGWYRGLLGPGSKRRLSTSIERSTGMQVKGVQTIKNPKSDGCCQTALLPEYQSLLENQKNEISRLLRKIQILSDGNEDPADMNGNHITTGNHRDGNYSDPLSEIGLRLQECRLLIGKK